jgi:LPS export ABC transporter protein LptC
MLRKYRYILLLAALLFAVLYWLIEGGSPAPAGRRREAGTANIVVTGGDIVEEKDGKRIWEIAAKTIEIDGETGSNTLSDAKIKFYRESGGTIDVAAGRGVYVPKTSEIFLSGGVVAVYSEGWRLKCQEARLDFAKNTVSAQGGAEFTKDDLFVYGDEIQADRELTKIKVAGGGVRKGK